MKGCCKRAEGHFDRVVAGITRRIMHGAAVMIAARAGLHPFTRDYIHSIALTCVHEIRVSLG